MALAAARSLFPAAAAGAGSADFFENRIRPVLARECYECHGAEKQKGGLRVDSRGALRAGGDSGPALVPGSADRSLLVQSIRHQGTDSKMPKNRTKLPDTVIADFVEWINAGAVDPRDGPPGALADSAQAWEAKAQALRGWWSFQPVRDPAVPAVKNTRWPKGAVDHFVLSRLEAKGFQPAPEADRRQLLRRATYGLTGLPPTPAEVRDFLGDSSPDAFAKVVDRLLHSPRYGERWGRHWLDVVRYADTAGDTADYPVGPGWRYRNYVIDSFNKDKPYDQFLREQVAGDILAEQGPRADYAERATATGFLAVSRRFGFDSEKYHHLTIQDSLDTLGQAALGLSLGCARCHDHKFDPISMKDYYSLYGIMASARYAFPGSEQKGKLRAMLPLLPPGESRPKWREFDRTVAALANWIERHKLSAPSAALRSLHDPDGDFETQKDAAGGSDGVIVPPWLADGAVSVSPGAQSPFKNLYPSGRYGVRLEAGPRERRLEQALYVWKTRAGRALLHLNLDFRPSAAPEGAGAAHRFWVGERPGSAAVELFLSSAILGARSGPDLRKVADLQPGEWHNLQLTLDLAARTFSGVVTGSGSSNRFGAQPFAAGWTGGIDHVALESGARSTSGWPLLELDNFGAQWEPVAPATKGPPRLANVANEREGEDLAAELRRLAGIDGGMEQQIDGAAPAPPWNPGPNSAVKIDPAAQSPFQNIHPPGRRGARLPRRAEYDGFGLTLPEPWTAARAAVLHVAFDFRTGPQGDGDGGAWRYYAGHGPGSSAAVELHFTGRELFRRAGDSWEAIARLEPGQWRQVRLSLNLKEKTYTGSLSAGAGEISFHGPLAPGWDGTIDYTFIDSHGHRPGVRPSLDADNFAFSEAPFLPLSAQVAVPDGEDHARRAARIEGLRARLAALKAGAERDSRELAALLDAGPVEFAYGVVEGTPHNARLQVRGEPSQPGPEIPRGTIPALGGGPLPPGATGSGRLELAEWLTQPGHPLTARVMVNRVWQNHFGRGLVATPNDFGVRGQPPSHPELLDWLAARFVESGWSVKAMHRLILSSAAYQQAPVEGGAPEAAAFASFQRRRLSAEEIRDSILAVSGELDETPGRAHPFPSPVTAGYTQHTPFSAVYDHRQRSVYLMAQRIKRHPFLALFDGPDPNATAADRRVTTVPTQALFFLNSPFVHENSGAAARRIVALPCDARRKVAMAWEMALGRGPTESERAEAADFLAECRAELAAQGSPDPDTAALAACLRAIFASNEFLHVD